MSVDPKGVNLEQVISQNDIKVNTHNVELFSDVVTNLNVTAQPRQSIYITIMLRESPEYIVNCRSIKQSKCEHKCTNSMYGYIP